MPNLLSSALAHSCLAMQQMKDRTDGSPAFLHPIRVALALARAGCPKETVIVGLLHDLLEDTDTTYDDLCKRYGTKIADAVLSLTHENGASNSTILGGIQTHQALEVKLADNADNIQTIEYFREVRKRPYLEYAQAIQDMGTNSLGPDNSLVQAHARELAEAKKKI